MGWLEKYEDGGKTNQIPEVTVYSKRKYQDELKKQQEKYLADMAKYKQDSVQWVKANQAYQDSLKLYNENDANFRYQADYYNTPINELKREYKQKGLVPVRDKSLIDEFMSPDFVKYPHILQDVAKFAQKANIRPTAIYPPSEYSASWEPVFNKPKVVPVFPIKPSFPNTIKYDSKYENLKIRSLWANKAKADTTARIGVLNPLDYNDESKGFTIGEAMKFPKEIKDKYNIDHIAKQIGIKKNGGIIPKADDGWKSPTVVQDIVDNLDYSRFTPEAIELRKRGYPEGFPRRVEDIRISPIDTRPQFNQGIYKTPEAIAAEESQQRIKNLHNQFSDFGTRTLTWGTTFSPPSNEQLEIGRSGWDKQLPMISNQAALALAFEMGPSIIGGAVNTVTKIPSAYNSVINAAKNKELYKYNPLAKKLDMSMGYASVSEKRAERMLNSGLVYRNVPKGETVHYFPIFNDDGIITQFVPKYEKEYFGKSTIPENPIIDVTFGNGKKIKMPLEQINQGKLNKYRRVNLSLNGSPLRSKIGPNGKTYIIPQEPSVPYTGKSSPDIKFKMGEVPTFYGNKPQYILQADPIKSALIKPAFKKQGSKKAGYPFSVNFNLKSGDWGVPLGSVARGEYSTLGEGIKLMKRDPLWGYKEVVDPENLTNVSKLPERILNFDKAVRSLPQKLDPLNVVEETKGVYRGFTYPLTSNYEIAGQNWTQKNIEDFDKVASIRKLYNAISVNDPLKKNDIINLLQSSPLDRKELWITMNNSIAKHPYTIDKFEESATKAGIFNGFIEIGKKYNSDFGQALVQTPESGIFSKNSRRVPRHIEQKILTSRQNALDKKLIKKNLDKLVKEIPNVNPDKSVIPSLARNYENNAVQLEAIKEANNKVIEGLPGIYTSAGSLSAESYPLTIMNMAKFTKDPRYEIFTSGKMTLNTLDDFANLGVSDEARANYINNFLRRADVGGKKLPRATVTLEGVSVPKVFVQKKYKIGGTIKNSLQLTNFTKPAANNWLQKYE